jgi:FAD:protein FMN transferase
MQTTSFKFEAIGTHWQIDIPESTLPEKRTFIIEKVIDLIEDFDKTYSRFRSDSFITQMAHKRGKYLMPDNAEELLTLYKELYVLTDHAFTPLIGQVLSDAGYDAIYSFKPKKLYRPPIWEDIMEYTSPHLFMKKSALLDFGAAGKGYLIDIVSDFLKKEKLSYFCVDAGGDIYYYNTKKEDLRVGLEDSDDPSQVIGVSTIHNQSICASAGNRRRWGEFHHIMDPHTLSSTHKVKATWVIAQTAFLADAIATCLFFVDTKKLQKYDFSSVVVDENNKVEVSKNFKGEIFT